MLLPSVANSSQVEKSKFKVGTLDSLMELNDSLGKLDSQMEAAIRKIEKQALDIDKSVQLKIERVDGSSKQRMSQWISERGEIHLLVRMGGL